MTDEMHDGTTQEAPRMNPIARLFNIFHAPKSVYESLVDAKWAWILPLMVSLILTAVFMQVTGPYLAQEQAEQFRDSKWFENMSQAQQDEAVENIVNPPGWQIGLKYAGMFIFVVILTLVLGLILLLIGNVFLGGNAKYWQYLNVYTFAGLVAIPGMLLKAPLMIAKESSDVRTSLAIILPAEDTSSFLFHILSWTDIFAIWMLVVAIIGAKVMLPRVPGQKVSTALIITYIVLALALATLAYFVGSFFM